MTELDLMFTAINRRKRYEVAVFALFFTADRSDEILEVGAIIDFTFDFNCN
jgi:hypothetical protein